MTVKPTSCSVSRVRTRPTIFTGLTLAVALLVSSCGAPSTSTPKNIFGPDNREAVSMNERLYTAVGRLDSGCTGTLISRRLVLTAAHCVIDNATGTVKPDVKYFRPAFANGTSQEAFWIDYMWVGSDKPEDNRAQDWAVLRLERAVSSYGVWAIHEVDFAAILPYTVSLIGYSIDRDQANSAAVHRGCYVHKVADGRLFHDCDATAGVSGGPLFKVINGNPHILGITVSEFRRGSPSSVQRDTYEHDYANVGIPASAFAATARTLIQALDANMVVPRQNGVFERTNPNARDPVEPDQPWDRDYRQQDLANPSLLAQRGARILEQIHGLRYQADFLGNLAVQFRDQALANIATNARQATQLISHRIDANMRGQAINPALEAELFYNYRILIEQEASLFQYTGWQTQAYLQDQIMQSRAIFAARMRLLEPLFFTR